MNETVYNSSKSMVNLSAINLSSGMHPAGFPPLKSDVLESVVHRIVSHL